MTELKTLKDIEMNENLNIVYSEDLEHNITDAINYLDELIKNHSPQLVGDKFKGVEDSL